jgi:hypothetical protein
VNGLWSAMMNASVGGHRERLVGGLSGHQPAAPALGKRTLS